MGYYESTGKRQTYPGILQGREKRSGGRCGRNVRVGRGHYGCWKDKQKRSFFSVAKGIYIRRKTGGSYVEQRRLLNNE